MNAALAWLKRNWDDVAFIIGMVMTAAVAAIAILLVVFISLCAKPAHVVDWPGRDEAARELARFERFFAYADDWLYVNSDPARRAIACRIGNGSFHIDALVRAAGLRREIIIRAANELMHRKLIAPGGPGLLMPYDGAAAETLRRWAERWCAGDDGCGVER